jgi:hypothetical protein
MPRAGFKPAIPATKRLQTYVLDRAATGIGTAHFTTPESSVVESYRPTVETTDGVIKYKKSSIQINLTLFENL